MGNCADYTASLQPWPWPPCTTPSHARTQGEAPQESLETNSNAGSWLCVSPRRLLHHLIKNLFPKFQPPDISLRGLQCPTIACSASATTKPCWEARRHHAPYRASDCPSGIAFHSRSEGDQGRRGKAGNCPGGWGACKHKAYGRGRVGRHWNSGVISALTWKSLFFVIP